MLHATEPGLTGGGVATTIARMSDPSAEEGQKPATKGSVLSPEALATLAKADTRRLDVNQKSIQRQARLAMVDRWLRAGLRVSQVVRLACFHFEIGDDTAKKLIKEVYREWAEGAITHDGLSVEERRHRDRLRIEYVYSLAVERKELANALRALELLCRVNGSIVTDHANNNLNGPMPPEVLAIRTMSQRELLELAAGQGPRVLDVEAQSTGP